MSKNHDITSSETIYLLLHLSTIHIFGKFFDKAFITENVPILRMFWNVLKSFVIFWNLLENSEMFCSILKSSEIVLESSEVIWKVLRMFWSFWDSYVLFLNILEKSWKFLTHWTNNNKSKVTKNQSPFNYPDCVVIDLICNSRKNTCS